MAGANFLAIGAPGVFYVTGEFTKNAFEVVLPPPFDPLAVPSASRAGSAALITALLLAAWLVLPRRARPA